MASLQGVLANIPGLGGYLAGQQEDQQAQAQQLAQVGALQKIAAGIQAQQQEQAFRSALSAAKTPEEQSAVAMKYGKPAEILGHLDRQTTAANTREIAIQRLTQGARDAAARLAVQERNATTSEQKAEIARGRAEVQNWYQRGVLALQAGKAAYELPPEFVPQIGNAPTGMLASSAPAGATGTPQWGPMAAGIPPQVQDAAAQLRSNLAQGGPGGTIDLGVLQAPQAAPEAPQPAPAPPNNLDARDLGAFARGPVAGPAPVAPTAQMPRFTGSPKDRAAAENKWRLAQAKGGEAGGKASETVVDAIRDGRMPLPSGFALRSPYWQDVIERVSQKDPNFDASRYVARAAARRTFASGPEARNVTALNTVIGHLGTLDEAAQALGNKDLRAFNLVANRLKTELGDPRVQNFDTAKQAVAEETMRVFRQVGASESEARMWGERIQSSGSPQQLRGVIGTLGKLLESRIDAIGQQYERTVNNPGNPARVDTGNRQRLDQLIQQGQQPVWDDTKEQRYQELLRKRGGS